MQEEQAKPADKPLTIIDYIVAFFKTSMYVVIGPMVLGLILVGIAKLFR